ncbi:MAG: phospholipase D-like domain-containing protein [Ginsengibacter sp.]|jgi:cardiolipin synthase
MAHRRSKHSNNYTASNRVKLTRGGKQYFDLLLQLIHEARESIHIQTYVYEDDQTGKLVAAALKEAVSRNVAVHLMADGYASQGLSKSFIDELRIGGVNFRFFEPIFRSRNLYVGRRLHHKVVVIDSQYALVGGLNIADRYNDLPGIPAWLDFALYVEGEIANELCVYCWKTWNGFLPNTSTPPCKETVNFVLPLENKCDVRMRRNDWLRNNNEITATYIEMLRNAKKEVTILGSYFLPGNVLRMQMRKAIKRGVVIRVIATSQSDVMLAKNAERWLYDRLLRKGIELYEYQTNILHGKIAVCDDEWMTVGSYNINNISTYASIELNLDVRSPAFAKKVRETLDEIIANDCILITSAYHTKTNNIFKQFIRWFSYQFIRIGFYLFTFYFKHQD